MLKINLNSLENFFSSQEFVCTVLPASSEVPMDYLFVHIGDDLKDRDLIVQINITEQLVDKEDRVTSIEEEPEDLYHLQLLLQFPFDVSLDQLGDLARLLLLINKSSGIPGLELSEPDRKVFWRHVMLVKDEEIDPYILISLVGSLLMTVNVFGDFIESIANGEKTFQEVVEEIQKLQTITVDR